MNTETTAPDYDEPYQQDTLALLKMLKLSEKSMQTAKLTLDQAFD